MMITVNSISKNFGKKEVLKNVSFAINHGEIVGLIGPNGSGKTTLMNILTGIINPSFGNFRIEAGIKTGMSVSREGFFSDMTTEDNMLMYSGLVGVGKERLEELSDYFSIDYQLTRYGKLSAGMKQRVALLMAFLEKYDLTYLDEPTNHLDVDSIIALRTLLVKYRSKGFSYLITSHILSDLEEICDRILFIKDGKIIGHEITSVLMQKFETIENAYVEFFKKHSKE